MSGTPTGPRHRTGPTMRGTTRGSPPRVWIVGRIIGVDAVERRREPVRVALAPDLAVGDRVDPGTFHVPDRDDGGVVLRLAGDTARQPARRPRIRTRGTECEPSTSRSISHSGWG